MTRLGMATAALLCMMVGCDSAAPGGTAWAGTSPAQRSLRGGDSGSADFAVSVAGLSSAGPAHDVVTISELRVRTTEVGWVRISAEPHRVDLATLQDAFLLGEARLPAGTVEQVKLLLAPSAAAGRDGAPSIASRTGPATLTLSGSFAVKADHRYELTLDFDFGPQPPAVGRPEVAGQPRLRVTEYRDLTREEDPPVPPTCPSEPDAGTDDPEPVEAVVTVPANADVFAAGLASAPPVSCQDLPDGGVETLPPALAVSGGSRVTFPSVTGAVKCVDYVDPNPPEGSCFSGMATALTSRGGISGILDDQANMFLVGVFTNGAPPSELAPLPLDFSAGALGHDFAALTPALQQQFFIGDGHTADGAVQQFIAPPGATTLYLGFADGYNFNGTPGCYQDNFGALTANVVVESPE